MEEEEMMERYYDMLINPKGRLEYRYGEKITFSDRWIEKIILKSMGDEIFKIIDDKYSYEESKEFLEEKDKKIKIYKDFIKVKIKFYECCDDEWILYIPIDRNDSEMIEKIEKFKTKYLDSEINNFLKGLM